MILNKHHHNLNNVFRFRDDDDDTELTRLSLGPSKPTVQTQTRPATPAPSHRAPPPRRRPMGKDETVPASYPWSEPRRATVCSLDTLDRRGITQVRGTLQCRRCERRFEAAHEIKGGFRGVAAAIAARKHELRDRAPQEWMSPVLPRCRECGEENAARPVISDKKRDINWLFLLLSGLLGCCTLEQLKYFCKHTGNHRTGAKDRVLYLAYLGLCNQLHPHELFDPHRR